MAAGIFVFNTAYIAPKMIYAFKKETILKVDQGLASIEDFSKKLTKK